MYSATPSTTDVKPALRTRNWWACWASESNAACAEAVNRSLVAPAWRW
ncbi:hypothetical protein J2S66_001043 [Saccharothrix longispora]|uniref:Uncharacterized protein n=1 Tax=Saccharothrix longispora TaxID=33920 RepID=A0ABU1PRC0_9PSEU|nr:hypothetical protein [Saccharothrix longispora]